MKKVNLENITLQELACFVYETLKSHGIDEVRCGHGAIILATVRFLKENYAR